MSSVAIALAGNLGVAYPERPRVEERWYDVLARNAGGRLARPLRARWQLIGGWVLLHGMVAEMETGEGKTLVATLPAVSRAPQRQPALAGRGRSLPLRRRR